MTEASMKNAPIASSLPVYTRVDLTFERGEGAWLWDTTGRRYLDFGSGIAGTGLGHCHPHLVKTLQAQAARLWHVSNLFRIEQYERLADRLVAHSFADTVFVCNSGAEAIEASVKMARRYHHHRGRPERNRIVTFEGAFHGRTMTGISATNAPKMIDGFAPLLDGFDIVPFADLDAARAAIGEHTGAIMIEPIQGEGGIRPAPFEYLRQLRELCDEQGLLLVLDEVQCGMGRTGTMWVHEQAGIRPDIMAVAKGLGGGFPIGACLATAEAASGMVAGTHGSTFGGNPLACAVADAVLDVMLAPGFLSHVQAMGELLREHVEALAARHPEKIAEVRGRGLLLGLRTVEPCADFVAAARETGLILVPASDNVARLLPPLTVTAAEIGQAVEMLAEVCGREPA